MSRAQTRPAEAHLDESLAQAALGHGPWRDAWHRMAHNPLAVTGLLLVAFLVLVAIFAGQIAPHAPREQLYFTEGSQVCRAYTPSADHLLGVDAYCRDTLSRLVYGARISLAVGIFTQVIAVSIGITIGGLAGSGPRSLDNLLMRFTDATYAFPDLLLIILFAAALRDTALGRAWGGIFAIFLAIGVTSWVTVARLIRGQVLALKAREFVLAARAIGASERRIFFRHLLPNALGPVIVTATFGIPAAIFAEAALSYVGIGIRPPTPSWGVLVFDGYTVILASYWPVLVPAAAIAMTMLAFTFLGDGLRDALDPRSRR